MKYFEFYQTYSTNQNDFLEHHGILGQKCGVRRYQNRDGSLTDEGRKRQRASQRIKRNAKTRDDVETIVKNLSPEDRRKLGMTPDEKEYLSIQQGEWVVKRIIAKHGDIPVAFFDVFADDRTANISLAVRSDYQGIGYGGEVTKKGMKWIDRNLNKFEHVEWNALYENYASRHLAEKYGFERAPDWDYENETGKYATYLKRPKGGKSK